MYEAFTLSFAGIRYGYRGCSITNDAGHRRKLWFSPSLPDMSDDAVVWPTCDGVLRVSGIAPRPVDVWTEHESYVTWEPLAYRLTGHSEGGTYVERRYGTTTPHTTGTTKVLRGHFIGSRHVLAWYHWEGPVFMRRALLDWRLMPLSHLSNGFVRVGPARLRILKPQRYEPRPLIEQPKAWMKFLPGMKEMLATFSAKAVAKGVLETKGERAPDHGLVVTEETTWPSVTPGSAPARS